MAAPDDIFKWDAVAEKYASTVGGEGDSFYRRFSPFLWAELGADLTGQRILDVGCGHGRLANLMRARGAEVVGIDGSSELIALAQSSYPDIRFVVSDLTQPLPDGLGEFDGAVAHMVLMDVAEIDLVFSQLSLAIAPQGRLVFSLLHPSIYSHPIKQSDRPAHWTRVIGSYLSETSWTVDSFGGHIHYHRPLSAYFHAAVSHGFVVTGVDEPRSLPKELKAEQDWTDYERWFSDIPTMISVSCERRPAS